MYVRRTVGRISVICALLLLLFGQSTAAIDGIVSVPNKANKIALTFDDGPHPKYTEQILDILKEYGVKATFFVIGENAQRYPELVDREIAEGHEIGNHTYTHPHMKNTSEKMLVSELKKAEMLLSDYHGIKPHLFRPPEGFCCAAVKSGAEMLSYDVILWDIDTRDWAHNSTDNIVKMVVSDAKAGDIILCHDFVSKQSPTPDALRRFIPALKEKGYEFVTVSELLESVGS